MLKTTLKGLLGHKLRLVTTMLAIVTGVAFMAGTLVLTDTLNSAFNQLFAATTQGTDALVRSDQKAEGAGGFAERKLLDESFVQSTRSTPGVADAVGNVEGFARFVDKKGKAMGGQGPPTFGFNWPTNEKLNPFDLVDGTLPVGPDQVVMDKGTADKGEFRVGDKVKVLTKEPTVELTVSGIAKVGEADSLLGASAALFDMATAQKLVGQPGKVSSVSAVAVDGVGQEELATNLRAAITADVEVITGAEFTREQQEAIQKEFLAFFNMFLLVFALIALFVGAFIIYNTFSILVAQRTREMALLRAIGASRRQVLTSVLVEALIIGALASGLGLLGGIGMAGGLKSLLNAAGFVLPRVRNVIKFSSLFTAFLTGVFITVFAALFPARRASKIPPLAAMRDVSLDRSAVSVTRIASGVAVTALGMGAVLFGLLSGTDNAAALVGLGMAVTFIGVAVLGPVFARPVAAVLGLPISKRGVSGRLARENAIRNPKRTASTAAALMIGVGLVTCIMIFAASIKASFYDSIDKNFRSDLVLDSGCFDPDCGISTALADDLRALPELKAVSQTRFGQAVIKGNATFLRAVDPVNADQFIDLGVKEGTLAALGADGVAVFEKDATENGWKLGDTVPFEFGETGLKQMKVVAVTTQGDFGSFILGLPAFEANYPRQLDYQIFTKIADGIPADQARKAVETVATPYPTATVQDITQYKEAQVAPFNAIFGLIIVLLGLAIFIAILGIIATLSLSTFERIRELGLMRSVGMTRGQLRSMVRLESVIVALFGTLLGLVVGTFFGWAIMRAISEQGFGSLSIPYGLLALVVVIGAFVGIAAAVWPAFRAARLNILDAVAAE